MALRLQHVAPEILNKVTKALGITALDQWYYVSHHTASKAIGSRVLNQFGGSLSSFLKHAYPQHHFDEEKLAARNLEKDQNFFEVLIRKLFPNAAIHTKARKSVGIINPETGAYLEIDIWIPSLKLGIEYQDKHHYGYQWYAHEALEEYKKRDDLKKDAMAQLGYTLITIGYWWDKTIESVAATIRNVRPDLLPQYKHIPAQPVPTDPPLRFTTESPAIPGVAGIMNPFIPSYSFDPTNWYAGEKHDGIRGVFNPSLKKLFSRSGNELSVLPSLLNDIPGMLVEGEIIAGRANYTRTAVVSYHSHHDKVNWPLFRYVLYDIPNDELGNYTQRYSAILRGLVARPFIFAQPAFRVLVMNKDHLKMLADTIISDAGEGVIAQQDLKYEYGRAKGLAKIKVRRDADAQVLHVNKLSCTCKLASGVTANIAFYDGFKPSNLNMGDIVSYYHNGYSESGLPKQAEIYKVRYDLTWEQLVSDGEHVVKRRSIKDASGNKSLMAQNIVARNKLGHWNKSSNVRAFLDGFASTAGFDPLVAENWYPVTFRALRSVGGGSLIKASNNTRKALALAYPELKFEAKKFRTHEKPQVRNKYGHWNNTVNARAFFDGFAKSAGFDPLVPENWYPVSISTLVEAGGSGLLVTYGYNRNNALSQAYPELNFEANKFTTYEKPQAINKRGHWNKPSNVRAFFDAFAQKAGFNPHVPENWYPITIRALQSAGGGAVLQAYGNTKKKALLVGYPELSFDAKKFRTYEKPQEINKWGHWNKLSNVRAFFDQFARTAGLDPLVPENWYSVTPSSLVHAGGIGLLRAYDSNMTQALSAAYPELKFDSKKLRANEKPQVTRGYWNNSSNVRAFLDEFARTNAFDPLVPENWNQVRNSTLQNSKGSGLLKAYRYNLRNVLTSAYPEFSFGSETGQKEYV